MELVDEQLNTAWMSTRPRGPLSKKRWIFTPERNKAVIEKVNKLLITGLIHEIYYLEWLVKHHRDQKGKILWKTEDVYEFFKKHEQYISQGQLSSPKD